MPREEKKSSFPVMPAAAWWKLRTKFKQSIPGVVTDNYVASILNIQLNSARANILPALKTTELIDSEGKATERARRWRDDAQYTKVCKEILETLYPRELLDGIPEPKSNREETERWFANHTGAGQAAAGKMTQFYTLLSETHPSLNPEPVAGTPKFKQRSDTQSTRTPSNSGKPHRVVSEPPSQEPAPYRQAHADGPAVHINLQIHISADSSAEQIEQIFASMAKHIFTKDVVR